MCQDNGSRPAGQAVAILRSLERLTGSSIAENSCTFTFSNLSESSNSSGAGNHTSCQCSDLSKLFQPTTTPALDSQPCEMRIHELGDLSSKSYNRVLYKSDIICSTRGTSNFALPWRLDLGVGGEGVIGRAITLRCGSQPIAEGVIGWGVQ